MGRFYLFLVSCDTQETVTISLVLATVLAYRRGMGHPRNQVHRVGILVLAGIALAGTALLIGIGWYVSDMIRTETLEPKQGPYPLDLRVTQLRKNEITLCEISERGSGRIHQPGLWGLRWDRGYAQVGGVLSSGFEQGRCAVREFRPIEGKPSLGEKVRLDVWAFPDDPEKAFGLPTETVFFYSGLGQFRAYFIEESRPTWVIFVHGKPYPPRKPPYAYPILPVVANLELPSLIITYRNDWEEPASPDGLHWYGLTEWEDLEGAAQYAVEHGAEDLILVGYSMGGGIVANFLYQSQLAGKVRGVILDAPMLNLEAAVDFGACRLGIPRIFMAAGKLMATFRFGIDWKSLNYLQRASEFVVPVLLFHGDDDKTIPIETSEALAKVRPDIVQYIRVPQATHVRSWNMDPEKYEKIVREFLTRLMG